MVCLWVVCVRACVHKCVYGSCECGVHLRVLVCDLADMSTPRTPAVAVAAGPYVYVYRNLRPYFKFTVPNVDLSSVEVECWEQLKVGAVDATKAFETLATARWGGRPYALRACWGVPLARGSFSLCPCGAAWLIVVYSCGAARLTFLLAFVMPSSRSVCTLSCCLSTGTVACTSPLAPGTSWASRTPLPAKCLWPATRTRC